MTPKSTPRPPQRLAIISGIGVLLAAGLFFILRWLRDTGVLFTLIGVPAPSRPCGGVMIAPSHPTVKLVSSSISPSGKIHIGQKMRAVARTNIPTDEAQPVIKYESTWTQDEVSLYDDGTHGDKVAHDGEWALDFTWNEGDSIRPRNELWLILKFKGNYCPDLGAQVTLDVEPATTEAKPR
jgi:hypothetical protein